MELSIILPSEDNQGIGSSTAKYFEEKQEMHNIKNIVQLWSLTSAILEVNDHGLHDV